MVWLGRSNCGWFRILKNSPRNCKRNLSVTGNCLNTEKSRLVRPGPRIKRRPALTEVNCAGVAHGAPAVFRAVLYQCMTVGLEICQSASRLGRLEAPVLATESACGLADLQPHGHALVQHCSE